MAVVLFACLPLVSALIFTGPAVTPADNVYGLALRGWTPRPTEPPSMEELVERQNVLGLILAPDDICGYISGSSASPFGLCCSTCTCGFVTEPNVAGKLACCNAVACETLSSTSCIDAYAYTVLSACGASCRSNNLVIKCTKSPFIYCNQAEIEGVNVEAMYCGSVTVSHTQSMYTTFSGQLGRVFAPFAGFTHASSTSSTTASSSSSSSSSTSSSTTSPTTSDSSTTTEDVGSQTSTTIITIEQSSSAPDSSLPIGAIVGGTVGGFAFVTLIGVGAFLFMKRPKRTLHSTQPDRPRSDLDGGANAPEPSGDPSKHNSNVTMAPMYPRHSALYDPNLSGAGTGLGLYTMQQQFPLQQGPADPYFVPPPAPLQRPPRELEYIPPYAPEYLQSGPMAYSVQQQQVPRVSMPPEGARPWPNQAQTQQAYNNEIHHIRGPSELSGTNPTVQAHNQTYQAFQAEYTDSNTVRGPVVGPEPPIRTYTDPNLVPEPLSVSRTTGSPGPTSENVDTPEDRVAMGPAAGHASRISDAPSTDLGSTPQEARMKGPQELNFDDSMP